MYSTTACISLSQVTADGSVSCWDRPDDQEAMTAQLLFCEVVAALLVLKRSGTLVVKTFTTLEHPTVCLMFLLACSFREVRGPLQQSEGWGCAPMAVGCVAVFSWQWGGGAVLQRCEIVGMLPRRWEGGAWPVSLAIIKGILSPPAQLTSKPCGLGSNTQNHAPSIPYR